MAFYKRKAPVKRRKTYKKKVPLAKLVKNILYKNAETKTGLRSSVDGQEIGHNEIISRTNALLSTLNGTNDRNNILGNRIGDEINLLKCKIKMVLECNERYSQCLFKIFVVKSAKGDTVDKTTLFCGTSNNKMIDNLNYERFTIIQTKTVSISAPNHGNIGSMGTGGFITGDNPTFSRASKIVTMNIKGSKFNKGGKIVYEEGSQQPKMYDYHLLVYAYSNYSTSTLVGWNVGRVNDEVIELFYKDL